MAYITPTATELQTRYPAFADVADATIDLWIEEGETETTSAVWPEDIRARAVMAYAAHRMAELGLGAGNVEAGVTSFKSGTFAATISSAQAGRTGFKSTKYGREFSDLSYRYFGGPRLAWTPPSV